MDLAASRRDAPNGGVGFPEETLRRRKKVELVQEAIHGFLEEKRKCHTAGDVDKGPLLSQQQHEDEESLSSLLTKLDGLEIDADSANTEPNSLHPNHQPGKGENRKEVELAYVARDLNKIKRQNLITHVLLGTVIVMTVVWQVNEMSFLLWVQKKFSNPFKSLGDLIKGSLLKGRGRKPVMESSPLPPVGVPDVTRADLPTLVISGDHRWDGNAS